MKLHAKFPTQMRGHELEAEISGDFDPPNVDLKIVFFKNGIHFPLYNVTREELAALMREAANAARRKRN